MARGWREMANAVDGEVQRWRSCWFVCSADHPRRMHGNGGGTECSRDAVRLFGGTQQCSSRSGKVPMLVAIRELFFEWVFQNLFWATCTTY